MGTPRAGAELLLEIQPGPNSSALCGQGAGTRRPCPGPRPYLIAFQPTRELFFNPVLFSLKRLVTQKFSKFPIISRREETPQNKTCNYQEVPDMGRMSPAMGGVG